MNPDPRTNQQNRGTTVTSLAGVMRHLSTRPSPAPCRPSPAMPVRQLLLDTTGRMRSRSVSCSAETTTHRRPRPELSSFPSRSVSSRSTVMGDSRSVLLIVAVTRLTNNAHMEGFIETITPGIELTAGVGQTVVGQFTLEGPPVSTPGSDTVDGAKNAYWRLNRTDGPATVEIDCHDENAAAT